MNADEKILLIQKTDDFIADVFDHVNEVGQVKLLQALYDFKSAVENQP